MTNHWNQATLTPGHRSPGKAGTWRWARPRRRASVGLAAALLLVLSSLGLVPSRADAAPSDGEGTISTFAGGLGEGRATNVGQVPYKLVLAGNQLYVLDRAWLATRAIDLTTGAETVAVPTTGTGFARDGAGNFYFGQLGRDQNCRVIKVSPTGITTTVAGRDGACGYSGDGGPATDAQLSAGLAGLALDDAGNLYIADAGTDRIRRVDPAGIITTVAGNGREGFSGDGGSATAASLHGPVAVVADGAGNLYLADTGNYRIRRVDAATGVITTVAGNSEPGSNPFCSPNFAGDGGPATKAILACPRGVALDGAGNLFIADTANHSIRRVDATTGIITTVAGNGQQGFSGDGGPATAASLNFPEAMAPDASGTLYIADTVNNRVRRVDSAGTITTVAGNGRFTYGGDGGPATSAQFSQPLPGVAVDGTGNVYIADTFNYRVRRVDSAGTITTVAGTGTKGFSGDGGPATAASFNEPRGVAVDAKGNLYIADNGNQRVRKVDSAGTITTVAGTGQEGFSGDGGRATSAQLANPSSLAFDASGNLYMSTTALGSCRVRKVDPAGIITTVAGTGTCASSGEGPATGDGGPATSAKIGQSEGLAFDGAGNLYISETSSCRVRKVDTAGVITTVAGTGVCGFSGDGGPATAAFLQRPTGVATDPAGNVYIADSFNRRVRKVDSAGIITTVAGTGTEGTAGDGGPATSAQLQIPQGLAVAGGLLYIGDTGKHNRRVRTVVLPAATSPSASPSPSAEPGTTTRVSTDSAGAQAGAGAVAGGTAAAISADGRYVAFASTAANLVVGDTNGASDIFVRDRQAGTTTRVSVSGVGGLEANGGSFRPSISADGQLVAFDSNASNLVVGDTKGTPDVFVYDRRSGATTRVSVDSAGNEVLGGGANPALSGDGRSVAFSSGSAQLVAGDTNGKPDVFVHDRQGGATTRVNVGSEGQQANSINNVMAIAAISADGRYVAFESDAPNLVAGDTNKVSDIFVRDRQAGTTTRMSTDSAGAEANGTSGDPALSADGSVVAFSSTATNLVTGDTNGVRDIFVRDRQGGTTTRVSVSSSGVAGNGASANPAMSANGRYVAFESDAASLVAGDFAGGFGDVFVHDRTTAATGRWSIGADGSQANGQSIAPAINGDGAVVAFESGADNLVSADTNRATDVFARQRAGTPVPEPEPEPSAPSISAVEPSEGPTAGGTAVTISGTGFGGASAVGFGSTPAASFKVDSDTRITATSPAGTGSVDVVVTTPAGTSATSGASKFTYLTRTYTGRATAASATVGGTTTPVGDTGALGAGGGAKEASVASPSVANLGSASVGHATTVGQGDATRSEASLADLNLTVGTTKVTASFAMANAAATCSSGRATLAASSQVANLVVNGKAVAVSGKANQVVALPVGQLVVNQQTTTTGAITVNALRLVVPGQADVVIASATAGITCAGSPECTAAGDRITGGGWITVGEAKANFGVAGGTTGEGLWGHLTYQDKGTNVSVKGTGVSAYTVTGPTSRRIEGSADIGGTPGTYVVDVADNSASPDTFAIRLSTGYSASGSLGGGNITLHLRGPCP